MEPGLGGAPGVVNVSIDAKEAGGVDGHVEEVGFLWVQRPVLALHAACKSHPMQQEGTHSDMPGAGMQGEACKACTWNQSG